MIVDTDILIWHMRGNPRAKAALEREEGFSLSVVTYAELLQGMRNKEELRLLRKMFRSWNARILYISEEISAKAVFYVERHFLAGSLTFSDALIVSTAIVHGETLLTANDRHYRMIKEVDLKVFRP
ncbi:MAG TPA: type II toxin-antitoxin system VapC family toxin [Candidatus Desulfaltia sp.]|nr:type II toxin-antitoxin system VapC family toxin [Candidatus Desulfaltia sp.]